MSWMHPFSLTSGDLYTYYQGRRHSRQREFGGSAEIQAIPNRQAFPNAATSREEACPKTDLSCRTPGMEGEILLQSGLLFEA
jgi:hypothetical protein